MKRAPEPPAGVPGAGVLAFAGLVGAATLAASFWGDASGVSGILPVGGSGFVLLAASLVAFSVGRLALPRLGRSGVALVTSATLLAVWTGLTMAWSIVPDQSWDVFDKTASFVAFLGLGVALAGVAGTRAARVGASLLALVVGVVLAYALLAKAIPSLDPEGDRIARLQVPVDYWNALALIADMAVVLGLWLGTQDVHRTAVRVAGGLLVYVATLALLLTLSRAGLAAAIVVVALWLVLSSERVQGGLLLVASAGPALVVAAWAFTRRALVQDGALRADRVYDGAVFGMFALFGVALVITLVVVGLDRKLDPENHRRAGRALLGVVGVGVVVLLVAFVAAVGNPAAWASDEISASRSCQQVANTPGRFGNVSANGRLCWWREAWRIFANNAPGGTGAGSFEVARKRYRINAGTVTEPHSVPMQELSDGGVVAFALFLALVGSGVAVSVRTLRRLDGTERAAAVALIGVPAAYLVHALVDFSWDFLATTAPTMVALGVLAGAGKPPLGRRTRPYLGIAAAVIAGAALISFASPRLSDSSVAASTSDLGYGQLAKARQRARWARILNPLSIEPIWALAAVDERDHHEAAALARYEQAVRLQPRNPDTWFALALYEYQVPPISLCLAYRYFNNAWTLDPRGAEWTKGGPLDVSRAAVNKGACKGVITPLPPPVGSYGPAG